MKAIILAGGLGTRLRSRVSQVPKVLAPINDRPFLAVLLDYLEKNSIVEVNLSIGYLGDKIHSTFGQSYKNIKINYIEEELPLGTGGALAHVLEQTDPGNYFLLNGDTYLKVNYVDLYNHHINQKSNITMVLKNVADCSRYGSVKVEKGEVTEFLEKSISGAGFINAGVYVLNSNLFSNYNMPNIFSFEKDFLEPNLEALKPSAFFSDDYFIDIGVPADYDRAQKELN